MELFCFIHAGLVNTQSYQITDKLARRVTTGEFRAGWEEDVFTLP